MVIKPLRPRQERFCRAFVHYGTASTAAVEAGYARRSARKQGWRLLRVPRIRARVREIQAELADHHNRTREVMVGKLEVVYQRSLEDRHFYAAARAAELQARLTGVGRMPAVEAAPPAAKPAELATEGGQMRHRSQNPSQMYAGPNPLDDKASGPNRPAPDA